MSHIGDQAGARLPSTDIHSIDELTQRLIQLWRSLHQDIITLSVSSRRQAYVHAKNGQWLK